VDLLNAGRTVRAVILAGGETRNPLTRHRSMPSVPLGSSLVLVDVPITNCLRAGINKIYVLTQFQSHSLNAHIASSYPPTRFGNSDAQAWVDVLAAQQTVTQREWYKGSADAVRKNMSDLKDEWRGVSPASDYVILSGAAVYSMDLGRVLAQHRARGADVTICTHLVAEDVAPTKGIARVDPASGRVLSYEEKPTAAALADMRSAGGGAGAGGQYVANMGIYLFKREALFKLLDPSKEAAITHIGHHVIPSALAGGMKVHAYTHRGYWHVSRAQPAASPSPLSAVSCARSLRTGGSRCPRVHAHARRTLGHPACAAATPPCAPSSPAHPLPSLPPAGRLLPARLL
jgi:glucose-1-phosphate adenylyltransferase